MSIIKKISNELSVISSFQYANYQNFSSLSIPNSIKKIENFAFNNNYCIQDLYIADINNINFEEFAFHNASNLARIHIPKNYQINNNDFINSLKIINNQQMQMNNENIYVNDLSIENFKFIDNNYIKNVKIGANTLYIGKYAFKGCKQLTNVIFEESNTTISIDIGAFYDCNSLQYLNINRNIRKVNSFTFGNCINLLSVNINTKKLEFLNDYAFYNCRNISFINLSLTFIKENLHAFKKCKSIFNMLKENNCLDSLSYYKIKINESTSNLLNSDNECNLLKIDVINENEYKNCNIKKIIFGRQLKIIEKNAFQYCKKIKSIEIPDSVLIIDDYAFNNCECLTNIKVSNSTFISKTAFDSDVIIDYYI